MTDDGAGNFSVSVDLAQFYTAGVTVNNIKFIYNVPNGSGGFYQNPGSGGFSTTDPAHTSGWSPVTISSLAVLDLSKIENKSFVNQGKLYTKLRGELSLEIYDMSGKVVEKQRVIATDQALLLNIQQKGNFILKLTQNNQTQVVKFIN